MIVVKTKMREIPECCCACGYYHSKNMSIFDNSTCHAVATFRGYGKLIETQATKDRPKWCPLKEVLT